jgi:hypothetical protein
MGETFQIIVNSPTANRSVYVIGAAGFCALIHQISTTKNQLVLYRPGLAATPPGKNQPAAPAPAGGPHWCHGFCQRENKQITS